jgi:hypothetical protein
MLGCCPAATDDPGEGGNDSRAVAVPVVDDSSKAGSVPTGMPAFSTRHHVAEILGGHSIDWHGLPDVINCRVATPPGQLHYAIKRCLQDHWSAFPR